MAETHQEVVKVWIAPGCIVCDACETDCPEVFDVQEETCVIRAEAKNPDFTKPLTPSIIVAAEGCPVDVIKFETVEVEGPEPWAGQEKETAAAAPSGASASKDRGTGTSGGGASGGIPEGPPAPRWAGLLSHASITRRGESEDQPARPRELLPAKAPLGALAEALPKDAPPDAWSAAMVGTGYARPRPSLAERIAEKAQAIASLGSTSRREFSALVIIGWGAISLVTATVLGALQSFMVPRVSKAPPSVFRAGKLADFPDPGVYETFKAAQQVWLVRLPEGKLVALSTICTHLGCIPNWLAADNKFKCPCHGSGYYMNGVNFEGPAPRPLERFKIYLDGEAVMVDKSSKYRQELKQWDDPNSYVTV